MKTKKNLAVMPANAGIQEAFDFYSYKPPLDSGLRRNDEFMGQH